MIKLLIFMLIHASRQEYKFSSRPVPKAELLDEVLSKLVNRSEYTGSLFSYLAGSDDFGDPDNLDVCRLDANNVFKLISKAKQKFDPYFRRQAYTLYSNYEYADITKQALDLMRQSIYATRYRMQDTKRYRKEFTGDARFHIAVLYGALIQVTHKMETLYAVMRKLPHYTYLIWYVIIYEKILAAHVDVHNLVDRIFDLNEKYLQIVANKRVRFVPRALRRTGTRRRRSRGTGRRLTTRAEFEDENASTTTQPTRATFKVNLTTTYKRTGGRPKEDEESPDDDAPPTPPPVSTTTDHRSVEEYVTIGNASQEVGPAEIQPGNGTKEVNPAEKEPGNGTKEVDPAKKEPGNGTKEEDPAKKEPEKKEPEEKEPEKKEPEKKEPEKKESEKKEPETKEPDTKEPDTKEPEKKEPEKKESEKIEVEKKEPEKKEPEKKEPEKKEPENKPRRRYQNIRGRVQKYPKKPNLKRRPRG